MKTKILIIISFVLIILALFIVSCRKNIFNPSIPNRTEFIEDPIANLSIPSKDAAIKVTPYTFEGTQGRVYAHVERFFKFNGEYYIIFYRRYIYDTQAGTYAETTPGGAYHLIKIGKDKIYKEVHVNIHRIDNGTYAGAANPNSLYSRYTTIAQGNAYVNGSVGLQGKFNVSDYVDIDIEARGEIAASYLGHLSTAHTVGGIYVGAGVTYTFGGKKFVPYVSKVEMDAINDEINKYRNELAQAQADLANAKNALANVKPEVREVVKEVEVAGPRAIFFKIGSARLDDYGKVNIQLAAKILKANPDKKYRVAGYADKATGSASWNQKLSEKRAQVVYDALIAEGVDKDQLELVGFGGTENMFGKNLLNRVVILE